MHFSPFSKWTKWVGSYIQPYGAYICLPACAREALCRIVQTHLSPYAAAGPQQENTSAGQRELESITLFFFKKKKKNNK